MSAFRRHSSQTASSSQRQPASLSRSTTNPFADPAGGGQGRRAPPTSLSNDFNSMTISEDPPPPPYQLMGQDAPVPTSSSSSGGSRRPQSQQTPLPPPAAAPQQQQQQQQRQSMPPPVVQPPPAPPAAAPQRNPSVTGGATGVNRRNSVEDPLSSLSRYDVIVLVDDSPSMVDFWRETQDALMGVVSKCIKYDKDGIDLWFLNNSMVLKNVTTPTEVREAFDSIEPSGSTPTGFQLDEILRPYIESVEDAKTNKTAKIKPCLLLCLTDGRADDPDMVKEVIVEFAQRLDDLRAPPYQLGISFIQVGNDPDASAFLKELDDDLKAESGVRDIVDTTLYRERLTPEFILKACLGSVTRSLDAQAS